MDLTGGFIVKVNIQELTKALKKYEDGHLSFTGKGMLKDDLLLFSKQLFDEGIQEGQYFELISITVEKDSPFPQLYKPMMYKDASSGKDLEFIIHEIVGLKKKANGDIVMDALVCEL